MARRSQVTKVLARTHGDRPMVRALCLDASRCAARRRGDLGPFLRSAHWRSLYLTPVVRPFRRYFPGKVEGMVILFVGAALAALAANSALATATSRSSSTPYSSRSAVHVRCRLRRTYAARHAAARAHASLCVRRSRRGSSRGGASRGGASGGESGSSSGSVHNSSNSLERM